MENTQQQQQQKPRVAVVRAIPHPPHRRRWCGLELWVDDDRGFTGNQKRAPGKHALPWPDFEVKVAIVDAPAPFDPNANGGVPVEISPKTLAMLERDERIAVRVLGGDGADGDPAEVVRVKSQLAEHEEKALQARRDLAENAEQAAAERERYQLVLQATEKRATELSVRTTALEAEVAMLRAQLDKKAARK